MSSTATSTKLDTPAPSTPTADALTTAEDRRAADKKHIEDAVRALLTTDGWRAWLNARTAFHAYSFGNSLLIASQCPTATRVAGFHTWRKLGRQVCKGERSIKIFAPQTYKTTNADGDEVNEVAFRAVAVFDIAQTDGDPLPEPPREPITGDSHADIIPRLENLAHELGYEIRREPVAGGAQGYCTPHDRIIVVDDTLTPNATVRVMIHEIAHALGITCNEHTRERAETLVESITYIVCGSIGLDTSGESIPYIAGWNDDELESLHEFAQDIDTIARKIERAVHEV